MNTNNNPYAADAASNRGVLRKLAYGVVPAFVSIMAVLAVLSEFDLTTTPAKVVLHYSFWTILLFAIGTLVFMGCMGLGLKIWAYLDSDAVSTGLHLAAQKLSYRIRSNNIKTIFPYLQGFLYQTIQLHNEVLHLPLGPDASCLIPEEPRHFFRKDCMFYQFQLIMAELPNLECETLKEILQAYIESELNNHGIAGLRAQYSDSLLQKHPSVYLDRVVLDEGNHMLTFDVLYVASESAVAYLRDALRRKRTVSPVEPEPFDDELR